MKIAKKIYALICDDIRYEENGKISMIGVYNDDIRINQIPTILPTLGIMIVMEGVKEPIKEVLITIKPPKAEPIIAQIATPDREEPEDDKPTNVRMLLQLSPFRIQAEGDVKINLKLPHEKKSRTVHTFKIINNEHID